MPSYPCDGRRTRSPTAGIHFGSIKLERDSGRRYGVVDVDDAIDCLRAGVVVEPAIDDRFDNEGREAGREVGVAIDDGVRGRMPGVLGVWRDMDNERSWGAVFGVRNTDGGFCVGVSGSLSLPASRPNDDGGRLLTASLNAWSISGSACFVTLAVRAGPMDDRGRRIDGVGMPLAVGMPLSLPPGDPPSEGRPGVASVGRRDIIIEGVEQWSVRCACVKRAVVGD